jgi:hypothetical protein
MSSCAVRKGNTPVIVPLNVSVVLAGIFGAALLCATIYVIDWWMRAHAQLDRRRENYGNEKGVS